MSDPRSINITEFTITDGSATVGTAPLQVRVRDLGLLIKGQLAGSTEFTRGLQSSVRIRSDCFRAAIGNCNVAP